MGNEATLPLEDALSIGELRVVSADGTTYEMGAVDFTGVDDDALVNGRYGGTTTSYSFEGTQGGDDETLGFWLDVEAEKNSDTATVTLTENPAFRGREEEIDIEELTITERHDW